MANFHLASSSFIWESILLSIRFSIGQQIVYFFKIFVFVKVVILVQVYIGNLFFASSSFIWESTLLSKEFNRDQQVVYFFRIFVFGDEVSSCSDNILELRKLQLVLITQLISKFLDQAQGSVGILSDP